MNTTVNYSDDFSIHSRAMLVALRISSWRATRMDAAITKEISRLHHVEGNSVWANKKLLPGAEPYERLISTINLARKDYYANTLAWSDNGWRLLPSANYMPFQDMVRKHHRAFESALNDFLTEYPVLTMLARQALNSAFNEKDYPSVLALQGKFRFGIEYAPLPARGDFRLDLPSDEISAIEAQVEDRIQRATREAVEDAWNRLQSTVEHVVERLSDPTHRFNDTLIGNMREVTEVLTRLNITGDQKLEEMRAKIEKTLAIHEPQTLRDDLDLRAKTAAEAQKILDEMTQAFGG